MNTRAHAAVLLYLALSPAIAPAADIYPSRPIRFIVPFPPGGGADTRARIMGQKMGEAWGQQVIIDNRPGGATNIAAELAAHAPPDGYTLLETVLAHVVNPSLFPKLAYDIHRDFAPVVFMATVPNILVVHPSLPVKTTRELIGYAQSRPGQLNYASTGNGGPQHLGVELFKTLTGVQLTHVPYKGAAPAHADIVSGQIQVMMIKANRILKNPELRERLAAEGADFIGGTGEAYGAFMQAESTKWAKVVKFARIKLD